MAVTPEQLAQQAASLRDNDAFQLALDRLRSGALEALATADVTETNALIHFQATVRVVDDLRDNVEAFIRAAVVRKPAGIA